jgi:hypothetical protein
MDHNFADELYSDILKIPNGESGLIPSGNYEQSNSHDHELDNFPHDDESLWGSSPEEGTNQYGMEREWQRRHDQFHTIGYRDGVTAGKEASAQEGFNIGFKESVGVGYNWGLVRGVTSALACLPDGLKEKLVETQEDKDKFQSLYESVHSLSTTDALKLFHDGILSNKSVEHSESTEAGPNEAGLQDPSFDLLQNYFGELKSLVHRSPAMEVNLVLDN